MNTTARPSTRSMLVAALALGLVALTATSASADSGPVEYSCEFGVGDPEGPGEEGSGTATASFDTAVPDGLVVDVGDQVTLNPFTGTVTFPEAFVTMLRDAGLTSLEGGGEAFLFVDGGEGELYAAFPWGPVAVPAEGPLTVELLEGDAESYRVQDAGAHRILMSGFAFWVETGEEEPVAWMFCGSDDEVVVDTFQARQATAVPVPTVTVTTAAPVRPVLVQTDAAQGDDRAAGAPVLGAGALVLLATAVGLRRAQRSSSRRH